MNQARTYALLLLLVVSVAVGASVWLANGEGPTVNPPVSGADECAGNTSNEPLRAMNPKPDARDGESNERSAVNEPANEHHAQDKPDPDDDPSSAGVSAGGNDDSLRSALADSGKQPRRPSDIADDSSAWHIPTSRPDADVQQPVGTYNGNPSFITKDLALFRYDWPFDRYNPDGMLIIHVQFIQYGKAIPLLKDCTFTVTSDDGSTVYSYSPPGFRVGVPYSYEENATLGFRLSGPKILPVEGVISPYGSIRGSGAALSIRQMIVTEGLVNVFLRVFPADYDDFRTITVQDEDGDPVKGAALTWDGVQILGRSDAGGNLRFPWPGILTGVPEHRHIREKYFFVTAPGYVPVLLERDEFEKGNSPGLITFRAKELRVSCRHYVTYRDALVLGPDPRGILFHRFDLIPVPDDWAQINVWQDVHRTMYGSAAEDYDRKKSEGKLPTFVPFTYYRHTYPFNPNQDFGDFGAQKLAEVLGREPTKHWPSYAGWYFRNWTYDDSEGRFDVVLPYAGRFLVLVGEYNRAREGEKIDGQYANGQVTHVLYIDARNPDAVQSKLLVHPLG